MSRPHGPSLVERRSLAYAVDVPLYEFRCKTCDDTFEVRRSMAESSLPTSCPSGHDNAVRLHSVFASIGAPAGGSASPVPAMPASGGGCGSACGCHH